MSRLLCNTCQRPNLACICQFVSTINNDILVVILLHPKEVNQTKGTLPLLASSLSNLLVIEGEDFSTNEQLNNLLAKYKQKVALLYPSNDAVVVSGSGSGSGSCSSLSTSSNVNPKELAGDYKCLILLDATWKKAYRMYMLSKNLHRINHIALPDNLIGQYEIRKTNKKNALSTLEACCYALEILEKSPDKYQGLLEKFVEFNQFQLSFRK